MNGAPSTDPTHGWGGPGGYVYQKAYVEFFCSPAHLKALQAVVASSPHLEYKAVKASGELHSSSANKVTAVTWGVFPNREVLQPTVMDEASFLVWKDEAFGLWTAHWLSLYPSGSPSANIIQVCLPSTFCLLVAQDRGTEFALQTDKYRGMIASRQYRHLCK